MTDSKPFVGIMANPKTRASFIAAICLALVLPSLQQYFNRHDLSTNFSPLTGASNASSPSCRNLPGDLDWPTAAQWRAFNQSVDGRLIATVPIASPCHDDSFEAYSTAKCAQLQSVWHFPETHIASSSSIMAPYFANRSCDPFTARGDQCVVGAYVAYSVNASEVAHYQKTLQFAKSHNIRFVIRNTGHDYYGKSSGAGSLAIWTQHLKDLQMLDWRSSTYTGKAVKMGAGVLVQELWEFTQRFGYVAAGGYCPTVGVAGGYTQGGGTGPLASAYGLAADQVLEWEVVDGNGRFIKANPETNSDLYWALSGGGGGSYGIVYSLTSKAYRDLPTAGGNLTFSLGNDTNPDSFWEAVRAFVSNIPDMTDSGISSLWFATKSIFMLTPMIGPGVTQQQMNTAIAPTIKTLRRLGIPYQLSAASYPNYLSAWSATGPASNISRIQIGGRLIPRSLVAPGQNISALGAAFRNITDAGLAISGVTFNVARQAKRPNNAVEPYWRDSVFSFVTGTPWSDTDWEANLRSQPLMTDVIMPQIERLTPGGMAYLNEGDPFQPNWQQVFYGRNYPKLLAIKSKYDPEGMFYGNKAVGSDQWIEANDGRLCRKV